jgi:hypothetical protein
MASADREADELEAACEAFAKALMMMLRPEPVQTVLRSLDSKARALGVGTAARYRYMNIAGCLEDELVDIQRCRDAEG